MGKIKSIHNNNINYNTNYRIHLNKSNVESTQKVWSFIEGYKKLEEMERDMFLVKSKFYDVKE